MMDMHIEDTDCSAVANPDWVVPQPPVPKNVEDNVRALAEVFGGPSMARECFKIEFTGHNAGDIASLFNLAYPDFECSPENFPWHKIGRLDTQLCRKTNIRLLLRSPAATAAVVRLINQFTPLPLAATTLQTYAAGADVSDYRAKEIAKCLGVPSLDDFITPKAMDGYCDRVLNSYVLSKKQFVMEKKMDSQDQLNLTKFEPATACEPQGFYRFIVEAQIPHEEILKATLQNARQTATLAENFWKSYLQPKFPKKTQEALFDKYNLPEDRRAMYTDTQSGLKGTPTENYLESLRDTEEYRRLYGLAVAAGKQNPDRSFVQFAGDICCIPSIALADICVGRPVSSEIVKKLVNSLGSPAAEGITTVNEAELIRLTAEYASRYKPWRAVADKKPGNRDDSAPEDAVVDKNEKDRIAGLRKLLPQLVDCVQNRFKNLDLERRKKFFWQAVITDDCQTLYVLQREFSYASGRYLIRAQAGEGVPESEDKQELREEMLKYDLDENAFVYKDDKGKLKAVRDEDVVGQIFKKFFVDIQVKEAL